MLVRAYTNSMHAIVKAATGATTVLLLIVRGNGRLGDGGGPGLEGVEASVVPPGPRGCERRAPMLTMLYHINYADEVKELEDDMLMLLTMGSRSRSSSNHRIADWLLNQLLTKHLHVHPYLTYNYP